MCLSTNDPSIKIATKDIMVYKRIHKDGKATLYDYVYKPFRENLEISLEVDDLIPNTFVVYKGYHSYVHRLDATNYSYNKIIATFIIPKGSKYIEGFYNNDHTTPNYVSSNIIWIKNPKSWRAKLFLFKRKFLQKYVQKN